MKPRYFALRIVAFRQAAIAHLKQQVKNLFVRLNSTLCFAVAYKVLLMR